MTHNLSFRYHADMTTKGLGLGSAKLEVLRQDYFAVIKIQFNHFI